MHRKECRRKPTAGLTQTTESARTRLWGFAELALRAGYGAAGKPLFPPVSAITW